MVVLDLTSGAQAFRAFLPQSNRRSSIAGLSRAAC